MNKYMNMKKMIKEKIELLFATYQVEDYLRSNRS